MVRRVSLAALLALLAIAPAARAEDARYEGISADGSVAFFSTRDKLVPGDTDTRRDIYARSYDEGVGGYVTREVSFGPTGGNNAFDAQYLGADEAGVQVFFSTNERLTAADKDTATDIYVRDLKKNTTTLVSQGDVSCAQSGCGNANSDVGAVPGGVVADGSRVYFATAERLSAADEDDAVDVYVRDLESGTTRLVSAGDPSCTGGHCGNGSAPAFFQGVSADGEKMLFTTAEGLVTGDGDGAVDLYEHDLESGATRLVSTPGTCPVADCTPVYGGTSGNGSHVFFETNERLSGEDTDSSQDVYDWSGGTATLASQGPTGGNGADNALFAGSSPDGEAVFFETKEKLVGADADAAQDVYRRSGGTTTLVSHGAASCAGTDCGNGDFDAAVVRSNGVPSGVFDDGNKVFFLSSEELASEDEDESFDVYVRDLGEGTTTLVSRADASCVVPDCGSGPHDANFVAASTDGSLAFFITAESLLPADADEQTDVYERSGGTTTLVSTGSVNGNGPYDAQLQGVSQDGSRAFFVTDERLTGEDADSNQADVYSRSATGTLLVSAGNDPALELGPPPPQLERTDPPSPDPSTEPRVIGSEPASAAIKLYSTPDCSGEPVATGDAEQLASGGIPAVVAPASTTAFRATAEAEGFTSDCANPPLLYSQQDLTPPPPPPPSSGGESGSGSTAGGTAGGRATSNGGGIAYVTPATRITFGPAFKTRVRRPVFRFTDSTGQPGTSFFCKLDRRGWRACSSPFRLDRLHSGRHSFSVEAVNALGAGEAQPATRRFKLVVSR
jgi:Tol biopolymer transport system component